MPNIFEILAKPLKLNPGVTTTPSPIPAPQPSLLKQFERPVVPTKLPEPKYKVRKQTFEDVKALPKQAKDFLLPPRGYSEEELRKAKPTVKETLTALPKVVSEVSTGLGSLLGGSSIFQKIAETKIGGKLADLGQKQAEFAVPKTAGEAKAMRVVDAATIAPIGSIRIGTGAARLIAKSRNPVRIAEILVDEVKNLDRADADRLAPLLVGVDNEQDVQRTLNKIEYAKNKATNNVVEVTPEKLAIASDFKKGKINEETARKLMQAESVPKPTGKEVTLYHTTTPDAAKSIVASGFKAMSAEDKIGNAFGEGQYFSTTPEEAEAWKQFTTNDGKGEVVTLKGDLNIYDPKVANPADYWDKLAKKAGIKSTPELGQEIADALLGGKGMLADDVYLEAIERSKKITQALKEQGIDGAKFVEPIDPGEGIVNPQVVIFNTAKANQLLLNKKEWYRGVDEINSSQGDRFYSESSDVAGDYGKVQKLDQSELPQNPLIVNGDKTEIAELIGYKGDPFAEKIGMPIEKRFDTLAKRYAQSKGYDGIIYEEGSLGARELHAFEKTDPGVYKASDKYVGDLTPAQAEAEFRKLFDKDEVDFFIRTEGIPIQGTDILAAGMYSPGKVFRNPMVQVVMNEGKISSALLYHEAFHAYLGEFVTASERKQIIENVLKNKATFIDRETQYTREVYDTKSKRAEEWAADDFANFIAGKKYAEANKPFYQKILDKIREWIRKATKLEGIYERLTKRDRSYVRNPSRDPIPEGRFSGGPLPERDPTKKGGLPEPAGKKGGPSMPTERGASPEIVRLEELPSIANDRANLANVKLNVKHYNISDEGKELIEKTVEEVKPEIEEAIGEVLSNKEAIEFAERSSKTLEKVVERESTLEWEASLLRARQNLAQMSQTGMVNRDYIDTLKAIKTNGTDIARKLQSYSIGADPKEISSMQAIIEAVLKITDNTEEILKAAEGVDFTNLSQATDFYRKYVGPTTSEWIDLIRYNSMLSSPKTHIINVFSNLLNTTLVAPIEKTLTGGLDFLRASVTGNPRNFFSGDGGRYLKAYFMGVNEATSRFAGVMNGTRAMTNLDTKHLPIATTGTKGKVVNTLSFPMRLLEASDQFFTALAEGGEKAVLTGRKERGVKVGNIETKAADEAAYRLFRQDLFDEKQGYLLDAIDQVTSKVQGFRNNPNPLVSNIAKFTVPFLRTPMNIFKQGVEYSPIGIGTIPGAKNKTEQFSKAVIGSAVFAAAATLLASNRLTWSEPIQTDEKNAYRAAGKQPYSVKIGDTWYSYQKLPPAIAFPLAMVSSINYLLENKKINDDAADMILTGIANYGNFLADQSYAKSIGDLLDAAKGEETAITRVISNYPQQLIPYRALGGWMARLFDPTQRKIDSTASFVDKQMQALMMNIPGLSQSVPARVDAQGNPIPQPNRIKNAVLPINSSKENAEKAKDYEKLQNLKKLISAQSITNKENKKTAEEILNEVIGMSPAEKAKKLGDIQKNDPEMFAKILETAKDMAKGLTPTDKAIKQLGVANGERAKYILGEVQALQTGAEKAKFLTDLKAKGLLTEEVIKQMAGVLKQ